MLARESGASSVARIREGLRATISVVCTSSGLVSGTATSVTRTMSETRWAA